MLGRARSAGVSLIRRQQQQQQQQFLYSSVWSSHSLLPSVCKTLSAVRHYSAGGDTSDSDGGQVKMTFLDEEDDKPWTEEQIRQTVIDHGLHAWGPTIASNNTIVIQRGEGPYLYDLNGKRYFDLSSQAICSNLGHSMPDSIREAINKQISDIPFVFASLYQSEVRAKMSKLMSEISPGDLNAWVFLSTGAEANEAGLRMARHFTQKQKIFTRRRAYHGASLGTLAMTGDSRCRLLDPSAPPGFIKMADPIGGGGLTNFEWSSDQQCLDALEEQILSEGPSNCAAIWLEGITGTCGWLKPSTEWVRGVRELCNKYEMLLAFDEVMAGIGRTGKLFSFENYEGVMPDMVTGAKGISGAYLPVGYVGVNKKMQDYFMNNAMPYGGTYQAHPTCLSAAYATMKYILKNDIIGKAKAMEPVILDEMSKLAAEHPIVGYRCHGMAGAVEVAELPGQPGPQGRLCSYNENHPKMAELKAALNRNGINSLIRGPIIHVAPPLITTEQQIRDAFVDISKAFSEVSWN